MKSGVASVARTETRVRDGAKKEKKQFSTNQRRNQFKKPV